MVQRSALINSIAAKTVRLRVTVERLVRKNLLIFQRDTAFRLALQLTMLRIAATLAVVGALLFSAGSAWADFDDGVAAYKRGDYATAFREIRPLAEQGDAVAQGMIGWHYEQGLGVPVNDAEAVKWYRKAAEQGHSKAQSNLGNMYYEGKGVLVNNVRAYMWWSLAKAQRYERAARNLDIVKKQMTSADISKAQALASEMWEKLNN